MMRPLRRPRTLTLQLETLERKTLLAGGVTAMQMQMTAPTPASDIQGLQQHDSSDHLVVFLSNVAAVLSTRSDVQQFATRVAGSHLISDLQIDQIAMQQGILLPSDISDPMDQLYAQRLLAFVNTPQFDQVYLATLAQVEQARGPVEQQFAATTQDPLIQQAMENEAAEDAQTAAMALALWYAPTTGGGALSQGNGPSQPTNDAEYVQSAFSTNNVEILASQAAALTSQDNNVQLYAKKLISDHTQGNLQVFALASNLELSLSPVLSPNDLVGARQVLNALHSRNFDRTYLSASVMGHQQDVQTNQQELARTQDPNVRQYAQDDIPTDVMHGTMAQVLLNHRNLNRRRHR